VVFGFFKIHFIPTGIPSVFTDINILSVNTDKNGDGNNSISKYHVKIPTEYFRGDFICIHRFSCDEPKLGDSFVMLVSCALRDFFSTCLPSFNQVHFP